MSLATLHPEDNSHEAAAAAWAGVAPWLAGRPRVRLSRDRGVSYPARYESVLRPELPVFPAAVPVYDHAGCARTIIVDLDAKNGHSVGEVEADVERFVALVRSVGGRAIVDRSITGGHHVYVPLVEAVDYQRTRAFMAALATVLPTLDPTPMLNVRTGLIRPPGSPHPAGGHQELLTSLAAATDAVRRRNPPAVWDALCAALDIQERRYTPTLDTQGPTASPPETGDLHGLSTVPEGPLEALRGWTGPDPTYQAIARTGNYDSTRYATGSEARQGVLWAAAASGWRFVDVASRIEDGTWAGLASLYGKYPQGRRRQRLVADWNRALSFEKARRQQAGQSLVPIDITSGSKTRPRTPGPTHTQIRAWRHAADLTVATWPAGKAQHRAVLEGLAAAAHSQESLDVAFGNRSLNIASGTDVGRVLIELRDAADPLIELIHPGDATRPHVYRLCIPHNVGDQVDSAVARGTLPRGKAGLPAVFRELGRPEGFVYLALCRAREPLSHTQLAAAAHVPKATLSRALNTLAAWNLARRDHGTWATGTADPTRLAEQLGVDEAVITQIERYRAHRRQWWGLLGITRLPAAPHNTDRTQRYDYSPSPPGHTTPEHLTPVEILQQVLGARFLNTA